MGNVARRRLTAPSTDGRRIPPRPTSPRPTAWPTTPSGTTAQPAGCSARSRRRRRAGPSGRGSTARGPHQRIPRIRADADSRWPQDTGPDQGGVRRASRRHEQASSLANEKLRPKMSQPTTSSTRPTTSSSERGARLAASILIRQAARSRRRPSGRPNTSMWRATVWLINGLGRCWLNPPYVKLKKMAATVSSSASCSASGLPAA